jgi:hypothetical protein
MSHPVAAAKVLNFAQEHIITCLPTWSEELILGGLREVEQSVTDVVVQLSDVILSSLLPAAAASCVEREKPNRTNVAERPVTVRLRSGIQVTVPSLYDKRVKENDEQPRHYMARHWSTIGGATPCRYDAICYAAVSLPSYDLSECLLGRHGVKACVSGVRDLTNKVASKVFGAGEVDLLLKGGETLAGKRVIISNDGGRTLTREANGNYSEKGNACFDAKWREPKLFVIDVIDTDGKQSREHLPIYGCRFSDEDHLMLLRQYLKRLNIDRAAEVQLIADGAAWIWNKVPEVPVMLKELGVKGEVTTETLDYYHAVQHLDTLFKTLPTRIRKRQRARWWKRCKEWLWHGNSRGIVCRLQLKSVPPFQPKSVPL